MQRETWRARYRVLSLKICSALENCQDAVWSRDSESTRGDCVSCMLRLASVQMPVKTRCYQRENSRCLHRPFFPLISPIQLLHISNSVRTYYMIQTSGHQKYQIGTSIRHMAFTARIVRNAQSVYSRMNSIYRVGQKCKLLILREYVNKTEKIGGM